MDLAKYERIFVQESEKYLDEVEEFLLRVEKAPLDRELWSEVHGKVHSIKGMARALSLDKISELAHGAENWCQLFQMGQRSPAPVAFQILFEAVDLLRGMVAQMGAIPSPEAEQLYKRVLNAFQSPYPGNSAADNRPTAIRETILPAPVPAIQSVRVRYSLIDELLGLSQEVLFLEKTLPRMPEEHLFPGFKSWLVHFRSTLKGLYFRLAQLRLMSVGDFADLFTRTLRDLALKNQKKVELEILGAEVQADMALLDRLREPFIHLLNNAIAHGIEPPDERTCLGKSTTGKVTLKAERIRDRLLLTLTDDGKGIDRAAITRYLEQRCGLSAKAISAMEEDAFLKTTLLPGFTTAAEASLSAGRGVGMNVFSQAISYLGGDIRIESVPGAGTSITVELPLVLSIVACIIFEIHPYVLCIPTSEVAAIYHQNETDHERFPLFYDFRDLFADASPKADETYFLKIKSHFEPQGNADEKSVYISVDRVIGNKEIMLAPAGRLLARTGVFSGVGVMENGNLAVMLDLPSILRHLRPHTPATIS